MLRIAVGQLIEQDHVEQRLMYLDAAVVTDKAELAKAIHEKADARPRGANHLRQGFLRDGRNVGFRFARLAKFGHQQENARQTFFAGVEELIDKIGLGSHAAGQQELQKDVGERRFIMHDADQLLLIDFERRAGIDGSGRGQAQPDDGREAFFTDEVASGEERNGGLFAVRRNDGESCTAPLQIKDGVCRISLGEEGFLCLQFNDSSTKTGAGKKRSRIKCGVGSAYQWVPLVEAFVYGQSALRFEGFSKSTAVAPHLLQSLPKTRMHVGQ